MHRFRHAIRRFLDHRSSWMKIMGVALLLRLLLGWQLANVPLTGDSLYYYQVAEDLAAGETFSTYWPPGLPLYEAGVIKLFGTGHLAVRLSMIIWFLLLCRLVYNLLNRMHSRMAANLGLLVLTFYPAFVYQSLEPLTQLPTATLVMAVFVGIYRYLQGGRKWLPYIGLAMGLMVMFRPSTALFFLLVPAIIFLQGRKFVAAVLVTLMGLSIVGPWIWFASTEKGHFVAVNEANARNFYLGNNAWTPHYKTWYFGSHWVDSPFHPEGFRSELDSLESRPPDTRSSDFMTTAFVHIGRRPDLFLLRTVNRARVFFSFDSFTGAKLMVPPQSKRTLGLLTLGTDALFFVGIGLGWLAFLFGARSFEVERRYLRLSYAFVILYTLPYLISFSHPSFHLPVVPLLLLPFAMFFAKKLTRQTIAWRPGWKWIVAAVVFLLVQIEWILQMTL